MNDRVLASGIVAQNRPGNSHHCDKVFVRDLVLDCEIGVFENEHGVTQRVRFDVELHIRPNPPEMEDNIAQVISYDMILDGIKDIISNGHIQLVETLAERIAAHCLKDGRVMQAVVRVEKLDKEPGAVGVEIVRWAPPPESVNVYRLWTESGS